MIAGVRDQAYSTLSVKFESKYSYVVLPGVTLRNTLYLSL